MGETRLKGVRRVRDPETGKVRWKYHRATGAALPVDVPEDSAEFIRAWHEAESGKTPQTPAKNSLRAVWNGYRRSPAHAALSTSYRRLIELDGAKLVAKGGHVPIGQIRARHIADDMAALEPHAANKRRKTWRAIMRHAVRAGLISRNPALEVEKPETPKADSHAPWSAKDVAAFRAKWPAGTQQRLAFEIMHYTGCRVSDAVRLGEGMVTRDGWLCFRQKKTGGEVAIPFRRPLPPFVSARDRDALAAALIPGHLTWMTTREGASRSVKAASQWFARACRDAGVAKTAHGLRATRAILLAEGGATTHQIGAWTGHKSLKEIEHYSEAADRRRLLSVQNFGLLNNAGEM